MKFDIPVEIKSMEIKEKRGTSRQGKLFHIREQSGYVDVGKSYPVEVKIPLEDNAPPYSVGGYVIDHNCLYVDRYGQLALGRIKLTSNPSAKTA